MKSLLIKEQFYKNLTPIIQERTTKLLVASKINNIAHKISLYIFFTISFIFIYYFGKFYFTVKGFSNLNKIFDFAKFLIIINGSILITTYITKMPKDNYNKAVNSLKNQYSSNICNCKFKCNCKHELTTYLKKQGIDLFK